MNMKSADNKQTADI